MDRATYGNRAKAALRRARQRAGLSQAALAALLTERGWRQFDQSNVWHYERDGDQMPGADIYLLWLDVCAR